MKKIILVTKTQTLYFLQNSRGVPLYQMMMTTERSLHACFINCKQHPSQRIVIIIQYNFLK